MSSNNNGKVLFALLGGLAAGAALALLFAPAKGTETRKTISDKAKGLSDELGRRATDLVNGAKETIRNNKEKMPVGNHSNGNV